MSNTNEGFMRVSYRTDAEGEYYRLEVWDDDAESWHFVSEYKFFPEPETNDCVLLNFGIVKELLRAISMGYTIFGKVHELDKD